jgi:hypothetical protein
MPSNTDIICDDVHREVGGNQDSIPKSATYCSSMLSFRLTLAVTVLRVSTTLLGMAQHYFEGPCLYGTVAAPLSAHTKVFCAPFSHTRARGGLDGEGTPPPFPETGAPQSSGLRTLATSERGPCARQEPDKVVSVWADCSVNQHDPSLHETRYLCFGPALFCSLVLFKRRYDTLVGWFFFSFALEIVLEGNECKGNLFSPSAPLPVVLGDGGAVASRQKGTRDVYALNCKHDIDYLYNPYATHRL